MIQAQVHQRARIRHDLEHVRAAREAAYSRHDMTDAVALSARIDALLDELAAMLPRQTWEA